MVGIQGSRIRHSYALGSRLHDLEVHARRGITVKSVQEVDQETCLAVQDIAVNSHTNPSMVKVHLKQSKTDPFGHGVDIFWGAPTVPYAQWQPFWPTVPYGQP